MNPHGGFLLIPLAGVIVAGACRWRGINPAIPLVVLGLAMSFIPGLLETVPDPELMLSVVLAPLVFAAGLQSSAVDLHNVRRSVLILAIGLVILTTITVGIVAATLVASLSLWAACALGAILAPTDAVAATAIAKRTGLPLRVRLVVEGESLANDGTALTVLRVAVVATAAGSVSALEAGGILLSSVVGGLVVGAAMAVLLSYLLRRTSDAVLGNAILLLSPLIIYGLAERVEGSGLLAVALAGVWIAHSGSAGAGFEVRLQARAVWAVIVFLLEALAFTLVGVELVNAAERVAVVPDQATILLVLATFVVLLLTRALFMFAWLVMGPKVRPDAFEDRRHAAKEFVAVTVLGVRGPVSVMAAFSLPLVIDSGAPFPDRDLILTVTFGVVILSLLASLAAGPIVRRLNMAAGDEKDAFRHARVATASVALRRLDSLVTAADERREPYPEKIVSRMRSLARRRIDMVSGNPEHAPRARELGAAQRELQLAMLEAERDELTRMRDQEGLPGSVVTIMTHEMDVRESSLRQPGRA